MDPVAASGESQMPVLQDQAHQTTEDPEKQLVPKEETIGENDLPGRIKHMVGIDTLPEICEISNSGEFSPICLPKSNRISRSPDPPAIAVLKLKFVII